MNFSPNLTSSLAALSRRFHAGRLVLFGSRARGDNTERSDIDLAVYGMPRAFQAAFALELEDLPTLFKFDVVHVTPDTDSALLANIDKDGVTLMERFANKFSQFSSAIERLHEAIAEYDSTQSKTVRDGAIQRFEFTTELAWKTLREYLIDQGFADINSPKSVIKTAFAEGIITDSSGWIELLNARSVTSHIYDDKQASAVYAGISGSYIYLFESLRGRLEGFLQ